MINCIGLAERFTRYAVIRVDTSSRFTLGGLFLKQNGSSE